MVGLSRRLIVCSSFWRHTGRPALTADHEERGFGERCEPKLRAAVQLRPRCSPAFGSERLVTGHETTGNRLGFREGPILYQEPHWWVRLPQYASQINLTWDMLVGSEHPPSVQALPGILPFASNCKVPGQTVLLFRKLTSNLCSCFKRLEYRGLSREPTRSA
jgi:hypothetical protein